MELTLAPLTPDRWTDLESLFGQNGAYGGCWCMFWRITRSRFAENGGEGNKGAMRQLVEQGELPGVLTYRDGEPVGWCSLGPRERFGSLERSPVLRRIDERPVWSLVCLFVERSERGQGVATATVELALEYAAQAGAEIVEAYPVVPRGRQLPPVSSYMGTPDLFKRLGLRQVDRPSENRLIMRIEL